ncbi:MAG: MCE family protein [Oligoflexia bacterium]|nr:MCE family protein [Oligoflexia bacterium]
MSRRKNIKLRVGFFVLIGILFLFAYILLIGGNQTYFNFVSQYKVKFKSVDGLFTGSVVKVNGIPAGNVVDIHFIQETGDVQVVVSILRKFTPAITDRSEASLATKGLLGDKYISITTKGTKGEKLPKGSYIPTQVVSGILGIFERQGTGDKIATILDELLVLVKSLNSEQTIKRIGETAHGISNMFSDSKSQEISQILNRLNRILIKLDEGEGTIGALINNKNVYNRILGLLGQRPYYKYLPSLVKETKEK